MKITIVGGGTSGWVNALILANDHPHHTFHVIESSKIGIIGVGESTTGYFTKLFNGRYPVSLKDFMFETNATPKYAIRHVNWAPNVNPSYIAPIDGSESSMFHHDIFFNYGVNYLNRNKFHKISRLGNLLDWNRSLMSAEIEDFISTDFALHIDGQKTSQYFKKHVLKLPNVQLIDTEVENVNLDDKGYISTLNLANGMIHSADFFIDCSGFNKILIKELEKDNWTSYKKYLPVNTAIPFFTKYKQNEIPEPYTSAIAQSSGWIWRGPLAHRRGNGYVFDSNFISSDDAIAEVESTLGQEIDPIKTVKFEAGRLNKSWIKNCFANGLCSQFLEPLEATAIHNTVVQAELFSLNFLRNTVEDTCNIDSQKIYNKQFRKTIDDIMHFLVMHYRGGREDTDFWKYVKNECSTELVDTIIGTAKSRVPGMIDFPTYYGSGGWPLYSHVMYQLGLINKDVAGSHFGKFYMLEDVANSYHDQVDEWNFQTKGCINLSQLQKLRFKN